MNTFLSDNRKPNLIIAGVHKAGTSSLYYYLSQHKSINASDKKELHYFTPIRYGNKMESFESYLKHFSPLEGDVKYNLEASPSYLYGGTAIANEIKSVLDNCKVILILREPSERLLSFYNHLQETLRLPSEMSFDEFFEASKNSFISENRMDKPIDRGLLEGCYSLYVNDWIKIFNENLKIVFFEELKSNPQKLMGELFKWLEIEESQSENIDYSIENKSSGFNNRFVHSLAIKTNHFFESFLNKNRKLKQGVRNIYRKVNGTAAKEKTELNLRKVQEFYENYNFNLYTILANRNQEKLPEWLKTKSTNK